MDRVIRRELYLSEGEAFNQNDLKDSQNALKRTGYFNDVQIQPHQVTPDKLDLIVNVNEASTGSIMGGISYGSYAGFGVNAGISDRNFMGTGIEIGTEIDYSMGEYGDGDDDDEGRTLKGSVNFYNPRLFDSLYSLGGNIFKKNYNYINYKEKSLGASLKLGRKITRNVSASLTYLYQDTELSDVDEALKNNVYYQEGKIVKSSFIPSLTYDNTDDYYLPRSGIHAGTSIEYAGVGGDAEFLSTNFSLKYYYGLEDLIDYDLILRFKGRVNIIEDNGYLPLNEKLYMGGMGTVRGFRYGTLAPRNEDINGTRGDLVGAKKMAAASFEMSFPLVESIDLRLMTFYDYGTTGREDFDEIHRSSVGIGIEWPKSPLGVPLQIFYARTLDDEDLDRTRTIEFNLGRRF
jgi:outer membrane protein insertion porin family